MARKAGIQVGLGVALATGASRLFAAVFTSMDTYDVAAYVAAALLVLAAAAAAAWLPCRRAARIDPIGALRYD